MPTISESAPWRGMHTVDYLQQNGHCEVCVNGDVSGGVLKARPPIRRHIAGSGSEQGLGFYCYTHADGTKYYLILRYVLPTATTNGEAKFRVFRADGAEMMDQNLHLLGQYPGGWTFSFAEIGDRVYFSNGSGRLWLWSPYTGMEARPVVLSNGVFAALNKYLVNAPTPSHLCNHSSQMVYSGLSYENWAQVNSDVPTLQNYLGRDSTNKKVTQSASTVSYNDHHVLFSDLGSPDQITAASTLSVYDGDPIIAAASLQHVLYLFSRRTINRIVDLDVGGDENIKIELVSGTIGCAAPQSIARIGNRIIFMADDGFYAIDAGGTLEKVSDQLDRIFDQSWEPTVPRPLLARLAALGSPWYPQARQMRVASAWYVPAPGVYLCSVTTNSSGGSHNNTTFAWHVKSGAWTIWRGGAWFQPRQWGSFADEPGTAYFLSTNGAVYKVGPWGRRGFMDRDSADEATDFIYVSRRQGLDNESHKQTGEVKVRIRGAGYHATGWVLYVSGEETQYDQLTLADVDNQAQSVILQWHPEIYEGTNALYYWGKAGFLWNTNALWTPAGRVTLGWTNNVVSRWFQYAFRDTGSRANRLEVYGVRSAFDTIGDIS